MNTILKGTQLPVDQRKRLQPIRGKAGLPPDGGEKSQCA
jgi:hypothetical protein